MPAPKGNKYYLQRLTNGRNPLYGTPEEMAKGIVGYFQMFIKDVESEAKPTLTGLAFHLGFTDKNTLKNYAKKEDFSPLIKRTLLFIESGYEELVQKGKSSNIFILKNMGWTDEQTLNVKDEYSQLSDDELKAERERLENIRNTTS